MSNLVWRSTSDKIYIKIVGEMLGDRITKPAKTVDYLSVWVDTEIRLLGHDLFPKSLASVCF
jgi:hypothetical protein